MTIYVISGGSGATGELLARTVAAQFPDHHLPIVVKANVTDKGASRGNHWRSSPPFHDGC